MFRDFAKMVRTIIPRSGSEPRNSERIGRDYALFHFNMEGKRYVLSIIPHDLEKPEAASDADQA